MNTTINHDDAASLAVRLEEEAPWESVSKVLTHQGWMDLVETIAAVSPEAYQALRKDLLEKEATPRAHRQAKI